MRETLFSKTSTVASCMIDYAKNKIGRQVEIQNFSQARFAINLMLATTEKEVHIYSRGSKLRIEDEIIRENLTKLLYNGVRIVKTRIPFGQSQYIFVSDRTGVLNVVPEEKWLPDSVRGWVDYNHREAGLHASAIENNSSAKEIYNPYKKEWA